MDERDKIDRFNRELDKSVMGLNPMGADLPREDQRSLELARRLAKVDFSDETRLRQPLRQRLIERSARRTVWNTFNPQPIISWTGLIVAVIWALGWVFGSLSPAHSTSIPLIASAYSTPGAPVLSTAPNILSGIHGGVSTPRPIPTPIAPGETTMITHDAPGTSASPENLMTGTK